MGLDLLLINPYSPNSNPMLPLGLAFLAATALEAGYSVQVVDAWAEGLQEPNQLINRLRALPAPRVTGISVLTTNLASARQAVSASRMAFPETLLVIGGPHVSALPDTVLNEFPSADLGVYGEGEVTLKEILKAFTSNNKLPIGLPGTIYRKADQGIIKADPRPPIKDLNILPRPARHLFPLDKYHPHPPYGRRSQYMNEITSRGCPFNCAYCSKSVFGNSYRALSPTRVAADIKYLVDQYKAREIHFYDDDLTLSSDRTIKIMQQLISMKLDLIWSCTTRCDLVDPELLGLMKKAGCWMISYGVESGNDALLNTVNKGVTRKQIETAFHQTKQAGIKTTAYFMIGLPGETEETVKETIKFADKLDPDYVNWAVMTVYPNSLFYFDIQKGKYGSGRLKKSEGSRSPFQDTFQLGFEENLSRKQMEQLATLATRKFYLHPKRVLRIISDIRSFNQLCQTARAGWEMLRWLIAKPIRTST